jgi:hypothetical protein
MAALRIQQKALGVGNDGNFGHPQGDPLAVFRNSKRQKF